MTQQSVAILDELLHICPSGVLSIDGKSSGPFLCCPMTHDTAAPNHLIAK